MLNLLDFQLFFLKKLNLFLEYTNASNALANRKIQVEAVQAKIERGKIV